ncbi:cadmium resistance transporter [Leifsonia shinshuensis]|uniref:cadmium resistance transporter n=1 Tax=Leifsonia shinshuensis TaxID=150026 RepID=UPI001F50D72C|nr:cadmium resistance transporter [Leifsonia shinshuensis]MCI0157119.1 cadmium resistance transporter [Leifsonia shinshuensis]
MLETIVTAVALFAGTNLDDLLVLTVLVLSSRATGRPRMTTIWVGQYLGIGLLIAASVVLAMGLAVIPDRWIGVLGLVPIGLGVRGLVIAIRTRGRRDGEPRLRAATGVLSVVGVTVANGGDNVSVYTALFRTIDVPAIVATVLVFLVCVAVWLLAARLLGAHRAVIAGVQRFGHWAVPIVFVVIGAGIVLRSGLLAG